MRPITPQSLCPIIVRGWAGSYRAWAVIGAILIGLAVIGLAGAMVIGLFKVSNKFENITGRDSAGQVSKFSENPENYYQGVIGLYRMSHKGDWTGSRTGYNLDCMDGMQNWPPRN